MAYARLTGQPSVEVCVEYARIGGAMKQTLPLEGGRKVGYLISSADQQRLTAKRLFPSSHTVPASLSTYCTT